MSQTIPFPSRCLTLLPPWSHAIAYAGKRLENRGRGVASQLTGYRGMVGLSQSKPFTDATKTAVVYAARDIRFDRRVTLRDIGEKAGKLWLVAEIVDVREPWQCDNDPWHVEGQRGVILGKVYEVKAVPCMGGQGAWRPQWCTACKRIVADSHGLTCKTCLSSLVCGPNMPALEIVRDCDA